MRPGFDRTALVELNVVRSARRSVGALAFSATARRLRGREQWLDWSEAARRENLHLVVNNSRFLILPHVHVPNLASHLLSRVLVGLGDPLAAVLRLSPRAGGDLC